MTADPTTAPRSTAATAFQAVVAVLLALVVGAGAPEGRAARYCGGTSMCIVDGAVDCAAAFATAQLPSPAEIAECTCAFSAVPAIQLLRSTERSCWTTALPPPACA